MRSIEYKIICILALLMLVVLLTIDIFPIASPTPETLGPTNLERLLQLENSSLARENEDLIITNSILQRTIVELQTEIDELMERLQDSKSISLSDDEFILVCRVIAAEARGEEYNGLIAVAQVIRDRLLNGNYGSTVSEVLYAPGQFASPWYGDLDTYPTIAAAVEEVFNGYSIFDGEAIYFFDPVHANRGAVANLRGCSEYFGNIGCHEFRGWIE